MEAPLGGQEAWKGVVDQVAMRKDLQEATLWLQATNFRLWFTWRDFLLGLLHFVLISLDIVTDFNLAHEMNRAGSNSTETINYTLPLLGTFQTTVQGQFASFTYFFIALPGLIFLARFLTLGINRFCSSCLGGERRLIHLLLFLAALTLTLIAAQLAVILATHAIQGPFFLLAIMSAVFTLAVTLVRVFLHTEEMKRFTMEVVAGEEQYESAFQVQIFLSRNLFELFGLNFFGGLTGLTDCY